MFKRWLTLCLVAALLAGMLCATMAGARASTTETTIYDLIQGDLAMKNIPYTYKDRDTYRTASVWFSPGLLLQDARSLSGEIAKASVALAMTAYNGENVDALLKAMGFQTESNYASYSRSDNYLTIDDCDHVAYTIAYLKVEHPVTHEEYMIYCVPIKGTSGNAEWFSNFNIGTGAEHLGFQKASNEILGELSTHFSGDDVDKDHTIVWFTGHSRGAACANLLAGKLSGDNQTFTKAEHVFAYTFACPMVSTDADTSLKNIHNFNNPGDLITMLPLTQWGFKRYGQSYDLSTEEPYMSNLSRIFEVTTGEQYTAETDGENYNALLKLVFGDDRDDFNNGDKRQLALYIGAWALGGHNDATFLEVLINQGDHTADVLIDILVEVKMPSHLAATVKKAKEMYDEYDNLIEWVQQGCEDTKSMSDSEFREYVNDNLDAIEDLQKVSGVTIATPGDLLAAKAILIATTTDISTVTDAIAAVADLYINEDGEVKTKVAHAHTQTTYTIWINSMYFGYRGWMGSDHYDTLRLDSTLSIGDGCFAQCGTLNTVELDVPEIYLGSFSFAHCDGLRKVTMPVTTYMSGTPFGGTTTGITEIRYTYGRNGIMPDRTYGSDGISYEQTPEYTSRDSIRRISFDEGITNIASYLFWGGSSALEEVELPSTVTKIGDYAFYDCRALPEIDLPAGLTELGSHAFWGCSGFTNLPELPVGLTELSEGVFSACTGLQVVSIPETVKRIGPDAFDSCTSMLMLYLPDTPIELGNSAFGNCTGLQMVTLPVDYDVFNGPFRGTDGVKWIHYTYGQTGIMPDRVDEQGKALVIFGSLENASRSSMFSIEFDEGITHIGTGFIYGEGYGSVEEVKVPSTLESIGDYAFYRCNALPTFDFHEGIHSIGEKAFYGCDAMVELTLPDTALTLGRYAFGDCKGLRTVTLPVDYDITNDPFGADSSSDYTDGVTTIHYTPGQSGIMPDRAHTSNEATYYGKSLEYKNRNGLTHVDFAPNVTHIGDYAFYQCTALPGVDLREGIVSLGERAFQNCDSLTELTIPKSMTAIGEFAFYGCDGLAELKLPDSVLTLGLKSFGECTALRTVTLPVDYEFSQDPFYGTTGVTTIHFTFGQTGVMPDRVKTSGETNYCWNTLESESCGSIQTIDFAEGITHIGDYLLYGGNARSLTEVKLPSTVTTIGSFAFHGCTALPEIDLHEGIVSLGERAFQNCDSLTELTIPKSMTSIGEFAFHGCDGLAELKLPDSVLTMGKQAFGDCIGLRTVTLPVDYDFSEDPFYGTAGVTTIHFTFGQTGVMPDRVKTSGETNYCWNTLESESCRSIQTIDFAEGITHIGDYLLYGGSAKSLTEVQLPSTLKTIGGYTFYGATALPDIDFPEGLVSLGDYAFYNCDSFSVLPRFPASLTTIGGHAFRDCDGFTEVSIPATVTAIGDYAFYDCDGMTELTLPDSVLTLGNRSFGECTALRTVTLPVDYDISKDPFYATSGVTTIHFTFGQTGIMPDRVKTSGETNYCWNTLESQSCRSIQTIDFAEGITHIGDHLLYGGHARSLTEVTLPSTVTTIGSFAFHSCTALPEIDLHEGIVSLGERAFQNCDSLTELTIPKSMTAIGDLAFQGCDGLAELKLPDTVLTLGYWAFGECFGLRTVTLPVDYDFSEDPFYGTAGVTTIHFTFGQTGVMPNRVKTSGYANNCWNTLESESCRSIQTIDFAEGITHIGDYLLYGGSAESLTEVRLPSTLEGIGSNAFDGCGSSAAFVFNGAAPEIADNAFRITTATCYYPASDKTWTADILQNYGGTLTWVSYEPPVLSGKSFSLSFEDEILVNFYYTISHTVNVEEQGMLVFRSQPDEITIAGADEIYTGSLYDAANDRYLMTTDGIAAKEMGDTRYYCAYAKLADGTYVYSQLYDYSPRKYAMNMLGRDSTSEKQKALCVAMLNYGAAAQIYFNHNVNDLMNAALTDAQQALVVDYDRSLFEGVVSNGKVTDFVKTEGFTKKSVTVSFEGAFAINFYMTPANATGAMTLYVWNPDAYQSAETLTAANAEIQTMTENNGVFFAQVAGIAAKRLDDTYYVAAVYTDADGNEYCTGVIAYSLSKYCMNNDSGSMADLAQTTAMYGYYADRYFNS